MNDMAIEAGNMSKRILIIDDEANIRQMTRLTLETAGYEVSEARDGMEALAILGGDASWDAVLLDQKMPGMVGTEVLKRLKVLVPTARVIIVTAFASVELAVEAMKLGATDFVRKPMTPEILRAAVAAALVKAPQSHQSTIAVKEPRASHLRTITLNGHNILPAGDVVGRPPQRANERRFIVRKPDGREQEVVVEIDSQAISAVQKVTHDLPLESAFWTEQAERFLTDFIWNDGNAPANGKLTLKGVEMKELEKALQRK